jgi:hypothetical protein
MNDDGDFINKMTSLMMKLRAIDALQEEQTGI